MTQPKPLFSGEVLKTGTVHGVRNPTKTSCPHPGLWQQPSLPWISRRAWALAISPLLLIIISGRGGVACTSSNLGTFRSPRRHEARLPSRPWQLVRRMACGFLAPSPTSELPVPERGEKGAALFLHGCFWKLPQVVWTRARLLGVSKPINGLLAASHLHPLLIQAGSPPSLS